MIKQWPLSWSISSKKWAFAAASAGVLLCILVKVQRRRDLGQRIARGPTAVQAADQSAKTCEEEEEEEDWPWALAEPPRAGPEDVVQPSSDLDEGLLALGLLSQSCVQDSRHAVANGQRARSHPVQENAEVDETVEVHRVSPEEEERRYFANMVGDFAGVPSSVMETARPKPQVAYEWSN